jgi:hypothetical protein
MSEDRLRNLWAAFLSGEVLSQEDQLFLLDGLRTDAATRAELLNDAEFDGMVRALVGRGKEAESVGQAFLQALEAERAATRFIKKVEMRIEENVSRGQVGSTEGSAGAKETPGLHRRSTRRGALSAHAGKQQPYLFPALLAAAVLLVIALLFGLSSGSLSRPDRRTVESARTPRERAEQDRKAALHREEVLLQETREKKAEDDRALAEKARQVAEGQLREIEEKRRVLTQAKPEAQEDPQAKAKRAQDLDALKRDQERIEQELKEAIQLAKKTERPAPTKPPQEEKPPSPPSAPGVQSPGTTQTALAQVEEVSGEAFVVTRDGKSPVMAGVHLLPGQGLETGRGISRIVFHFPDKTRVDLGPETLLAEMKIDSGKRLAVTQGTVQAVVAKQPKGEPLIVTTPHGQAKVVGTTLRLYVDPDPKKGTRLEVEEGKVELKNLAGKTALAESGHYAVAAVGVELVPKAIPAVDPQGLRLWLKADMGVAQNLGSVSRWSDQSGSGTHAVQPDPRSQPTLVPDAINGFPALAFDGSGSFMNYTLPVNGLEGITLAMVTACTQDFPSSTGSEHSVLYWPQGGANANAKVYFSSLQTRIGFKFGTGLPGEDVIYARPSPLRKEYTLTLAKKNGPTVWLFVNGRLTLSEGGKQPTIAGCQDSGVLGKGHVNTYFVGNVAEILIYDKALSDPERQHVERYLMNKYALAPR